MTDFNAVATFTGPGSTYVVGGPSEEPAAIVRVSRYTVDSTILRFSTAPRRTAPGSLATGAAGRTAWALYGVVPLVFFAADVGAFEAVRVRAAGPMRAGMFFAWLAAVSMMLGLMRWPSVLWELGRAWGAAGEATA